MLCNTFADSVAKSTRTLELFAFFCILTSAVFYLFLILSATEDMDIKIFGLNDYQRAEFLGTLHSQEELDSDKSARNCGRITTTFSPNTGLGNHMFFYASLIGVANRNSKSPYVLSYGVDKLKVFDVFDNTNLVPLPESNISYTDTLIFRESGSAIYMKETEHMPCDHDSVLDGYFQSWRYFQNIQPSILRWFRQFNRPIDVACEQTIRTELSKQNVLRTDTILVGVHLRRGDFTWNSTRHHGFEPANAEYLKRAVNYFRQKFSNSEKTVLFLILGNEFAWSFTNSPYQRSIIVLEPQEAGVDFCILVKCDHVVVSTGSFGWWAGYLSPGLVTYQKKYARPDSRLWKSYNPSDYFPAHWIPL